VFFIENLYTIAMKSGSVILRCVDMLLAAVRVGLFRGVEDQGFVIYIVSRQCIDTSFIIAEMC